MKRTGVSWGFWVFVLSFLVVGMACRPGPSRVPHWMKNNERRTDRALVAVFTPPAEEAGKLVRALRSELSTDFDVHVFQAGRDFDDRKVAAIMQETRPSAVVLVDNPTVNAYGAWARAQQTPPPSVIVMSSFAAQLQSTVPNSQGISFEPPAVTSLTDVRRILEVPVTRVGVIYRSGFETFVAREKDRAAREKIELLPIRVPRRPSAADVHRALEKLRDDDMDALWVSNDNGLLTGPLIQGAWLPFVKRQQLPVVVGVPSLVDARRQFGTFAAVPDIEGIGLQAADLIFTLADHEWTPEGAKVYPPVSVRTFVDVESARRLGMSTQSELTVDVLVEKRQGHESTP